MTSFTNKTGSAQPHALADVAILQDLLDSVAPPFEPLDISAVDGFLCGVLLQPVTPPPSRWMRFVIDIEGRPADADYGPLKEQVLRRRDELERAITQRQWFDPWIFESDDDEGLSPSDAVSPWVAGFAVAMEHFPALMALDEAALQEALVLLYRHLDPDDLEDADDLLAEIETLEPPVDLAEAVEDLVHATLLLADVSKPQKRPAPVRRPRRARR